MMSGEVTVVPQCRLGLAPAASLRGRRLGGWFDHLASAAGGDGRVPFLACGHDRVQLAQQRGGDGCVGLPTVELVLAAAGQVGELGGIDRVGALGSPDRPPGAPAQSGPSLPGQLGPPGVGPAALLPWRQTGVFDHRPGAGEAGQVAGLGQDGGSTQSGQADNRSMVSPNNIRIREGIAPPRPQSPGESPPVKSRGSPVWLGPPTAGGPAKPGPVPGAREPSLAALVPFHAAVADQDDDVGRDRLRTEMSSKVRVLPVPDASHTR
jgi:hypothetical protein